MNPSNQIQQNFDLPTPPIGAPVAPELRQLAEALGIMVDWQDAQGQACSVAAPVLQAIISNMGLPCRDVAQCEAGLAHIAREDAASIPPPRCATQPCTSPGQTTAVPGKTMCCDLKAGVN